jgi:UPF0271 protein
MADVKPIRFNCDMGEETGNDADLMPYLDACSIACGGHIGTSDSMRSTIELAFKNQVNIGAHPSYPDKENFGRKAMNIPSAHLQESLYSQIHNLKSILDQLGLPLHHIKAHGALYNKASADAQTAEDFITVCKAFPEALIFCPWQSAMEQLAISHGLKTLKEAFADRRYYRTRQLVSRKTPNSVITDVAEAAEQVTAIHNTQKVKTLEGELVTLEADTFCIHGDNPAARHLVEHLFTLKKKAI